MKTKKIIIFFALATFLSFSVHAQADSTENSSTPFGGENFTFGCDDNICRLPCTYNEAIAESGYELRDYKYAPDPERNPEEDGKECKENCSLYVPGENVSVSLSLAVRSYKLGDDGISHIMLYKGDSPLYEADTYGECEVKGIFGIAGWGHEPEELSHMTFACGTKLGMSQEEIHSRLGEPIKTEQRGDYFCEYYVDGVQTMSISYLNGLTEAIQMDYNQEVADQIMAL